MAQAPSLTIHLYSFGYKVSGPPADESGHGGGFVFDCRALPNPYWDEVLRPHTGLEPPIAAFMESHSEVEDYAERAAGLVLLAARVYRERGYGRLMVAFGCTGGRHRSVYQAELLRRTLEREGFRVEVRHADIHAKPADGQP